MKLKFGERRKIYNEQKVKIDELFNMDQDVNQQAGNITVGWAWIKKTFTIIKILADNYNIFLAKDSLIGSGFQPKAKGMSLDW